MAPNVGLIGLNFLSALQKFCCLEFKISIFSLTHKNITCYKFFFDNNFYDLAGFFQLFEA